RPELGGNHRALTTPRQRTSEEPLALRSTVDIGGIEQGDAGVERSAHDALALRVVDSHPKVIAAETDGRHRERTDASRFHRLIMDQVLTPPFGVERGAARNSVGKPL